jgi:predicted LPLAT superfamily acyltransferase
MLCLGLYEGGNRYRLVFEPLADTGAIERAEREAALDALLTNYVARLEHYARRWPGNWFNFYDFWDEAAVDDEAAGGGRGL